MSTLLGDRKMKQYQIFESGSDENQGTILPEGTSALNAIHFADSWKEQHHVDYVVKEVEVIYTTQK